VQGLMEKSACSQYLGFKYIKMAALQASKSLERKQSHQIHQIYTQPCLFQNNQISQVAPTSSIYYTSIFMVTSIFCSVQIFICFPIHKFFFSTFCAVEEALIFIFSTNHADRQLANTITACACFSPIEISIAFYSIIGSTGFVIVGEFFCLFPSFLFFSFYLFLLYNRHTPEYEVISWLFF